MILDRNKSELTHKVTAAAESWLDSHGFKPVETEVCMPLVEGSDKGWVADIAALIVPTQTELIDMKMISRRPKWRLDDNEETEAWNAKLRPLLRCMTCLVEVKTTRSDFTGDRKWKLTPPADISFLAVPSGLVRPEEFPEGWGVLELRSDTMVRVKSPVARETTVQQQFEITYEIAIRRDHRTRYAKMRELQRGYRVEQAVDRTHSKIGRLLDAIADISSGKLRWSDLPITSVERVLGFHGLRDMNERHMEKLAHVFKIPIREPGETV